MTDPGSTIDSGLPPAPQAWRPSLSSGIAIQDVEEEAILLDKDNQLVHHVDSVGAKMLAFCDGRNSVDDIVCELLGEFEVGEKELADDVAAFFGKMRTLKILT
jgi:hypothetical protein